MRIIITFLVYSCRPRPSFSVVILQQLLEDETNAIANAQRAPTALFQGLCFAFFVTTIYERSRKSAKFMLEVVDSAPAIGYEPEMHMSTF